MTTQTSEYARSVITAEEWEPFVVGGVAIGEVHWIRTEGAEGATLNVGLWRSEPQMFPYPFNADETIHALEGELIIDLVESGEKVVLTKEFVSRSTLAVRPGKIAVCAITTAANWII